MKLWVKNTILAVILVLIIAVPLLFMGGHEFGGSDDQASDAISELDNTWSSAWGGISSIRNYKSDSHRYAVFHSSDNAHIPSVSAGFHFENEEPGKDAVGSPWIWWKNPC